MKIAVLDDYQKQALKLADWDRLDAEVTVFEDTITDHAALVERLRPFEVICLMRERTPMGAELIAALPGLKLIVTTGARNQSIDIAAAAARGVVVSGTESRGTTAAELAMLLILALSRRLLPEALSMATGGWQIGLGRDLHGLTLGLIGLGRLGGQVAALAQPFGMKVIAWSENLTDARCREAGVARAASLTDLMARADAVSVHLVLSERTRGLIGARELGWMKRDAVLVNTSRGPIVESRALLAALENGRLGGAAIDVYDTEPLPPDDPLRHEALIAGGRLLPTPHIGYVTRQTYRLFYEQTVEAIAAWKQGAPIRVISP